MKILTQSKGQAALETVVASMALMAFSVLLLALIYFCVLQTYLQYSSHEMLVCREISDPWNCEKKFKKELQAFLLFGSIDSLSSRKESQRQVLNLRLNFTVLKKKIVWKYEDEIALPLKSSLNNQEGFAYVFFLSFLPLLLAGFLVVLFSQFFIKNWMESKHICRTELLSAQKQTGHQLSMLMDLNAEVRSLRAQKIAAEIQLAAALAAQDYADAGKAQAEIQRIKARQQVIDTTQKGLIRMANFSMRAGVNKVISKLKIQSTKLQPKLPDLFSFKIGSIDSKTPELAVQPDSSDVAPVYELKSSFTDQQALSVSWISEFRTRSPEKYKWILQRHKKQGGCSASLEEKKMQFQEILTEVKSSLKL